MFGAIGKVASDVSRRPLRYAPVLVVLSLMSCRSACAEETLSDVPALSVATSMIGLPDTSSAQSLNLPRYTLDIELYPEQRRVNVVQEVVWTNSGTEPTDELVFQVVANNKLSKEMIAVGERTVESMRLEPRHSIDKQGRRFHLTSATSGNQDVSWRFGQQHDTHLHLMLNQPVAPGDSVQVALRYWIDIPPIMGRLGQHKGVTNLLNWYPVLAVHRQNEWQPVPYTPWHQPWHNEAGIYDVTLKLPADQKVVTGGHVTASSVDADGYKTLNIRGDGLRDFTIVASRRFHELTSVAAGVPIRVLYFPEHKDHATVALRTAEDSLRTFSNWFGPYP